MEFMTSSQLLMMDLLGTILILRGQPTISYKRDIISQPLTQMARDMLHNVMNAKGSRNLLRRMKFLYNFK